MNNTVNDTVSTGNDTVNNTVGTVDNTVNDTVDSVNNTVGTVDNTVNDTVDSVNNTVGAVDNTVNGLLGHRAASSRRAARAGQKRRFGRSGALHGKRLPPTPPLTARHSLRRFWQPLAFGGDLPKAAIDLAQILFGQLQVGRRDVLLESVQLRGPWDWNDPRFLG